MASLPTGIGYAIGIVIALLILAVAYCLLMIVYSKIRRRLAGSKYAPEIIMVGIIAVLNIAIKFMIISNNVDFGGEATADGHAFSSSYGILDVFRAVYAGIGNFTFEGLDGLYATSISKTLQMLYYGSSLLTALVFASVIMATANYEFFSRVSLLITRRFGKNDFYIFTALTEETLMLAESITAGDESERASGKKRHSVIIFAGSNLDSFDRKNELCRRVMANGFYYWSYNATKKSVTAALKLKVKNGLSSLSNMKERDRLVVFSFNAANHIPTEEENMDFVFSDIRKHIEELSLEKGGVYNRLLHAPFVEYYVLTEREINYQAYQYKVDTFRRSITERVAPLFYAAWHAATGEGADKPWEELSAEEKKAFLRSSFKAAALPISSDTFTYYEKLCLTNGEVLDLFGYICNVSVWNEANAIAFSTVDAFQQLINKYPEDFRDFYERDIHVCSVGFGLTAQSIVRHLYVHTSFVFEDDAVSTFHVEAFDPNSTEITGFLQYENPLSVYLNAETLSPIDAETLAVMKEKNPDYERKSLAEQHILKRCAEIRDAIMQASGTHNDNAVMSHDDEIRPMAVTLHDISALKFEFVKKLDEYTGEDYSEVRPQFVTIATGDDYRNIKIVNALVLDILKEDSGKKQIIIMNVWDSKNLDLINRYNENDGYDTTETFSLGNTRVFRYSPELTLIVVGNNFEMYSERCIISYGPFAKYAVNYTRAQNMGALKTKLTFAPESSRDAQGVLKGEKDGDIIGEKGVVTGVVTAVDNAVNRITGEYLNGHEVPVTKEEAEKVYSAFCALCVLDKNEVTALLAGEGKEELRPLLGVPGNAEKMAAFTRYVDEMDFYVWKCWCGAMLWEKESNMSAFMFGNVYRRLFAEKGGKLSFEDYIRLINIEHQRWMRVHMCNGWTFAKKKMKPRRAHDSILPLYAINEKQSYSYDLINVIWGVYKGI